MARNKHDGWRQWFTSGYHDFGYQRNMND